MRKPAAIVWLLAAALTAAGAGSAYAQEDALNRVIDGDFENAAISLSLPDVGRFPLFIGGWASRGRRVPDIVVGESFEGGRALRLATRPDDPLQIIQDLPLNSPAYGLRFAFLIEEGSQRVRLLGSWDRTEPGTSPALFDAHLSANGIDLSTEAGTWRLNREISRYEWHTLTVIADPRTGTHTVLLDGQAVVSLPGVSAQRPSTIVVGGDAGDSGSFRYDAVEMMSLIDLEMAGIRQATAALEGPARGRVEVRLSSAAMALDRGAATLALPELGVARDMLNVADPADETLRRAISELIALIEMSGEPGEDREIAQYFF